MGRTGIEALLYLLDEGFRGRGIEESNESQALIPNLATVPDEAWRALPPGGVRSIEAIAIHVGACKIMYDDYAFGPGKLQFATPAVEPWGSDGPAPKDDIVAWLEQSHGQLVDHVRALESDDELDRPRMTNWGELRPTRWIVATMITHDAYHAGEMNHIRSILGPDDRWRYVQLGYQ
jgi:DinB family protein